MEKKIPNTYVAQVDLKLAKQMQADLKEAGFEFSQIPYAIFSAKKTGVTCVLYESGKLVVQGKEMAQFIEFYLEPQILKKFTFSYAEIGLNLEPHIGVDESGKGDYFGPLCVAAVYADREGILRLKEIGVKDSKTLNDTKIVEIGRKIQKEFQYHIVKINPSKYNEIFEQFKNLNRLLAWGHATCIENLIEATGCKNVLIDQFADESVVIKALARKNVKPELTQRHRGEEDLVVAAASILARQTFVEGLKKLGDEFDMVLPKGASAQVITTGRRFVNKYGQEALKKVGKWHFKTTNAVLEP